MPRMTRAAAAATLVALLAGCGANVLPTWTPSQSVTRSPSVTPSPSVSASTSASPSASPSDSASTSADPSSEPSQSPSASPATSVTTIDATIPYGAARQEQMAEYSRVRYGDSTAELAPRAIVLHFTESGDNPWETINYFAANEPNAGTLPGVCTHFVIDKAGTVYSLVPTHLRCRHTVGLNHVALGIEMVQSTQGHSSTWADDQILAREPQMTALLSLVRRLQGEFGIPTDRVLGHGTANEDPDFKDLTGMRNDHTDIGPAAVAEIRRRLAASP